MDLFELLRRHLLTPSSVCCIEGDGDEGGGAPSGRDPAPGDGGGEGGDEGGEGSDSRGRYLTEEELQEMRDSIFAEARRTFDKGSKKSSRRQKHRGSKGGSSKRDSGHDDTQDRVETLQLKDEFRDALDEVDVEVPRRIRKRLMRMYLAERPEDPEDWIEEALEDLGFSGDGARGAGKEKKSDDRQPDNEEEDDPPSKEDDEVSRSSKSDKGAPGSTTPDYDTVVDPNTLTADDLRRMEQKYGRREMQRRVRKMAEAFYKGRRIDLRK